MDHRLFADKKIVLKNGELNIPIGTSLDTDPALFYTLALLRKGYRMELQDNNDRIFRVELRHGDVRLRRDTKNRVRYLDTTNEFPEFFCKNNWDIHVLD